MFPRSPVKMLSEQNRINFTLCVRIIYFNLASFLSQFPYTGFTGERRFQAGGDFCSFFGPRRGNGNALTW